MEADFKSGALITSTYAGDYGRDVFAVPGQVYAKMSRGCNELIRDGARLIKNAQDILEEYDIVVENNLTSKNKSELKDNLIAKIESKIIEFNPKIILEGAEAKVFEIIPADDYITGDEILMKFEDLELDELDKILVNLELKNYIEDNDGRYKRKIGG